MTLTTYGMEVKALDRLKGEKPSLLEIQISKYIEDSLPHELKGCVKSIWSERSQFSLASSLSAQIDFPGHGEETISMETPHINEYIDIVEAFVFSIKERYHQLSS